MDTLGERGHMLANMERMAGYLREVEHKTSTKQMDMFDLGGETNNGGGLILQEAPPLSFEEKIREERNAIGMSISGDPLDGLRRYIEKKSLGLAKVQEFLKTLEEVIIDETMVDAEVSDNGEVSSEEKEIDTPPEEEIKKEKQEKPIVQVIGYVDSIKKIQTKKGDNMLIVGCSSTGWKFTTVVFPKSYNQVAHLFKE